LVNVSRQGRGEGNAEDVRVEEWIALWGKNGRKALPEALNKKNFIGQVCARAEPAASGGLAAQAMPPVKAFKQLLL